MDDEGYDMVPVDLSPLDPTRDPERWEALVARINGAAAPELERRADLANPVISLAAWLRPALAAAATLAVISSATLLLVERPSLPPVALWPGETIELNLPSPLSEWLQDDRPPTVMEVMVALEGESR